MKRLTTLGLLTTACFAIAAFDASSASAQQFISQTYDLGDTYTYRQPTSQYNRQVIPYWQAYGNYNANYYANHNWPRQDYLPQQRFAPIGFYSNGFYSNSGWSNSSYSNQYQPIQSNSRSRQNRRVIHVRLR